MKSAVRLTASLLFGLIILLLNPVLASPIPGLEPAKSWDLDGYIKYMGTYTSPDDSSGISDHLLHQRFNFEYRFDSELRFNVSMRNRLFYGDSAEVPGYGDLIGSDPGYWDMSTTWLDNDAWVGNTQFDRAYIDWKPSEFAGGDWQARVGRFRINWAMSTLWNPNDIFNAYSIYDFDYEERSGADAVLISRQLGFASSLDFVYNPNQDSKLTSFAMRYLSNYESWDLQFLIGKSGFDHVLGAGFAGDLSGAGFRGEFSYFDPQYDYWPVEDAAAYNASASISGIHTPSANAPNINTADVFNAFSGEPQRLVATSVSTLEMDYSFTGPRNWMVRGSVLHISNPTEPDSALLYLNLPLTARTLSFTNWTRYLELGFDISPLSRLTFSSSFYDDGSYFIGANMSYSLANEWSLLMVAQRFDGSSGSLFGVTPSTLGYMQLKWSF
ncbi:hypothetical protein FM037_20330 [Shewanella psychropiezotolerans]|uniref:Alginate export domain-containing protein n=1 Tax=Shewanella psychropiezotolerans TaxID=2593655 RepID=A0ABX5X8T5_9GAMM|nr:hypothetical protein [Shewanella sp. YLB-07]MPY21970.1 hypothetical protein [Shewanella sp. YLB-07]QDO86782.1 hypothetical protein FM037_20330 [Shewanella psychropiezotolerans]